MKISDMEIETVSKLEPLERYRATSTIPFT